MRKFTFRLEYSFLHQPVLRELRAVSGPYYFYHKTQATACTVICSLPRFLWNKITRQTFWNVSHSFPRLYFISISFLFHCCFIVVSFLSNYLFHCLPSFILFLFPFHFIPVWYLFHSYFISFSFIPRYLFHCHSSFISFLFHSYLISISFLPSYLFHWLPDLFHSCFI